MLGAQAHFHRLTHLQLRGIHRGQHLATIAQLQARTKVGHLDHARRQQVDGGRPNEGRHKAVGGLLVQRERCAGLLHMAFVQHHDLVAQRHGLHLVMRHIDHGGVQVAVQARQLDTRLGAQCGVQVGKWLIKQKQARLAHDGAANRHALALPA